MSRIGLRRSLSLIASLGLLVTACNSAATTTSSPSAAEPSSPASASTASCSVPTVDVSIPEVTVKFSNAEFLDDTPAILGATQGWFEAVGITLDPAPAGAVHTPSDHAALLLNGTVDIITSNYAVLLPALANTDNLRTFAYADFFLGWAVMGKSSFKTYNEFVQEGMTPQDALTAAVTQMSGKTLTWSTDPGVRNPGRTLFALAGLDLASVTQESLNDEQGIQLMLGGKADFQIGGAPVTVTLTKAGFKSIISAADLTGLVQPPYDSPQSEGILALVTSNGLATTKAYMDANPDTIMRFASVYWAIARYIHDHPDEAAPVHVEQLNRLAGTDLTAEDAKVIYNTIDPYIPFEDQAALWFDPTKSTYEPNMINALIDQLVAAGTLEDGIAKWENMTAAPDIYQKAVDLKAQADTAIAAAEAGLAAACPERQTAAQDLLTKAQSFYDNYDFLDAVRHAEGANTILAG